MAALRRAVPVRAFAHITGGGVPGNLVRALPQGCGAVIERGSWPVPRVFAEIQRRGDVADDEMARVFNLGLGMVAVVPTEAVGAAQDALAGLRRQLRRGSRGGRRANGHPGLTAGDATVGDAAWPTAGARAGRRWRRWPPGWRWPPGCAPAGR